MHLTLNFVNQLKLILGILLLTQVVFSEEPSIRVKVASSQKRISIKGNNLERLVLGKKKSYFQDQQTLNFDCISKNKNKPLVTSPMLFSSIISKNEDLLYLNKRYWGELAVIVRENNLGCDLINEIPFEKYINLVIVKEMNPHWPVEALKAQAVAARSYALYKKETNFISKKLGHEVFHDVENSEQYQVNGTVNDITMNSLRAISETRGEILILPNQEKTPIFYHSKCGGKTLLPEQVWNHKINGYESVTCPFCHQHGVTEWRKDVFKKDVYTILKKINNRSQNSTHVNSNIKILEDNKTRSKINFYDKDKLFGVQKSNLRQQMGLQKVLSNYFHLVENNKTFTFIGRGYGHGVGMCQFGALELAKRGYTYKQILKHYYPNHDLSKIY